MSVVGQSRYVPLGERITAMSSNPVNPHAVTVDAMRAHYPEHFEPSQGYERQAVRVEDIQPGDFLVSANGRRSLAGAVVRLFDWLDTANEPNDSSKWRKLYFVQLENFVPLTRVEPYKVVGHGNVPTHVEVYRPIVPKECEHGLSADLCEGPQHYPYDDEERQAYGF